MLQGPKTLSDDVPWREVTFPTMESGLELARRLSKLKGPLEVSGVDDRPLTGTSLSRERHAKKSRSPPTHEESNMRLNDDAETGIGIGSDQKSS